MARERAALTPSQRVSLIVIVLAAALLRLAVNDVADFSPADETIYVDLSARLAKEGFFDGYPAMARTWVDNPRWWIYPSPLRFGYLALTTAITRLHGSADPHALAWLSTVAGILVVPLSFAAARRICETRTALLATAFVAVSPLQLALGRRALQDEVFCAAVLLAFVALLEVLETPSWRSVVFTVIAMTAAFAVKESLLLLYPAFVVFVVSWNHPRFPARAHAVALALPPLLWWCAVTILTRDPTMLFTMARLVFSATSARYVLQYQSGPPHRLLFDFLLVSPFVTLLASGALLAIFLGRRGGRRMRSVALFALAGLAAFSLLASKNLRFAVPLDPFLRLLAAWAVVSAFDVLASTSTLVAAGVANAAIELELFRSIFLTGAVYDPVTHTILSALGAVPRGEATRPPPMSWPWLCGAVLAAVWLWRNARALSARGEVPPRPAPPARDAAAGAPQ